MNSSISGLNQKVYQADGWDHMAVSWESARAAENLPCIDVQDSELPRKPSSHRNQGEFSCGFPGIWYFPRISVPPA